MIGCPNDPPCGHNFHDIYEMGDPYPTCCHGGCKCGHPGDATLQRHEDGTVTVLRADPVIVVDREVLTSAPEWAYDGDVLQLDTAGEYRYELLRRAEDDRYIFGRIREEASR